MEASTSPTMLEMFVVRIPKISKNDHFLDFDPQSAENEDFNKFCIYFGKTPMQMLYIPNIYLQKSVEGV